MFSVNFKIAILKEVFKEDDAYGSLHDTYFAAMDETITEEEAHLLFFRMPEGLQCDALKWGLSDTEVRDNIYTHILKVKNDE